MGLLVALDDYGALIQSGQNLVPDYLKQGLERAQTAALGAETQNYQAEAQANRQKQIRAQAFQDALSRSDGSPSAVSRLMMQFPEVADHIKQAWDVQDKANTDADLTTTAEIYSAANSGKWDLAKKLAHTRADAERAAGRTDPTYEAALESMDRAAEGNPTEQKAVLNLLGSHLAAVTGPEHFGTVYGALKGTPHVLGPGAVLVDENNDVVAHSPLVQGADGTLYDYNSVMGGAAGKGGDTSAGGSVGPAAASVASALSASGLPAPVVAGFMGNFSAEGGYTGAQGDGGSASGIGQWRGERAANFEKITGKPVTEATPADQAQFVAWEMKNPEAAGMTVAQRDQILAAKTPAQAAALIDKFYERSDGSARQKRMAAATAFAGDTGAQSSGPRVLLPGKSKEAPSGYQWSADGTLKAIPGGPADTAGDELDPQTANLYAQQYLANGQMPPMGMGKAAAKMRQQIMKQVASIAGAEGLSGRDLATQIAHFKAGQSNVTNLEKQLGTIQGNEDTALKNADQFIQRSRELPAQTGSRLLNTPIQTYLRQTNDPTVAAMDVAARTFATEYARVVAGTPSGGGTLSDSARNEFTDIVQGNFPLKQKMAAVQQMKIDMANRTSALKGNLQSAYQHLTDRAPELKSGGGDSGATALPKGAKIVGTYQGKRVIQLSSGKRMVEQ